LLIPALLLPLSWGCGNAPSTPEPAPSPSSFVAETPAGFILLPPAEQALYATLNARLSALDAGLPSTFSGKTAFGAELLSANGNSGEALLSPQAMTAVRTLLDALQRIGVQGVTVQIADPLLVSDFPRSAEYLDFYKQVASEIRRRGLLFMAETGPVFVGTDYSDVQVGDRWRTKEQYFSDRTAAIATIVSEIKPDYLSLGNEPDTEQMLTHLTFSLDEYVAFLQRAVSSVQRGGVKLGAGTGTWQDPAWARRLLADVPLDFLDLHLYPLTNGSVDYTQRMVELTREARAKGKEVVIGEAWLYKVSDADLGKLAPASQFGRDYFDVWATLDGRFVEDLGRVADREGMAYASFFWSKYLFAYLTYSATNASKTPRELMRLSNQAASDAMRQGSLTPAGLALQKLAAGFKGR